MSDPRFDSEAFNRKLRKVLTFVLGSVLALVAVFAVCTGHIEIGKVYHREISAAENPIPFWALVTFYVALAVLCFWDLRRQHFHFNPSSYFYYLALPWSLVIALCCGFVVPYFSRRRRRLA